VVVLLVVGEVEDFEGSGALVVDAVAGGRVPAARGWGAPWQPVTASATTAAATAEARGRMIGECRSP
jgi:hypothetical protein